MKIAVIGATGMLGREVVTLLGLAMTEGRLPDEAPLLFAGTASAGEPLPWLEDEELVIDVYEAKAVREAAVALLLTPEPAAREITTALKGIGVRVIDASRAFRTSVPLFGAAVLKPIGDAPVIALPGIESASLATLLKALTPFKPVSIRTTWVKAASGAGLGGQDSLAKATASLLNGQEPESPTLPHRLAFNVVPQSGPFDGDATQAELDLSAELGLLLGRVIAIDATISWGPWFHGDFATVNVGFEGAVNLEAVRDALSHAPGLKLVDVPAEAIYPMPSLATGDSDVLVGRVRADPVDPKGLRLVLAVDGVHAGATRVIEAVEAIQRRATAH